MIQQEEGWNCCRREWRKSKSRREDYENAKVFPTYICKGVFVCRCVYGWVGRCMRKCRDKGEN